MRTSHTTGEGQPFPGCGPGEGVGTEGETTHGLGCSLQLLLGPTITFLREGKPKPCNSQVGLASELVHLILSPSTSQEKGNTNQQLQSQQEGTTFSLLDPGPNMKTLVTWKQPPKSLVILEEVLFLSSA